MNDRRLANIPKILETPKGEDLKEDIENLDTLKNLVDKI
jgi:endonuclease IV